MGGLPLQPHHGVKNKKGCCTGFVQQPFLLCGTIWNALRVALGIFSGKNIFIFVVQKRLRAFLNHFFYGEKLFTEAALSVKMRLSRPAGRDKRKISIGIPLKNGQSEAETIKIVLLQKG